MDPRLLRHFVAVYETGQFNLAADRNGVTPQAVSQAIARLEEQLDVRLFDRTPSGVAATVFADALNQRARSIITESRLASSEIAALRGGQTGVINIGFGASFAPRIMPRALARYLMKKSGIGVNATVDVSQTLYPKLLTGEIDLALSAPPLDLAIDPQITTVAVGIETDVVLMGASHPLLAGDPKDLAALARYPWISEHLGSVRWKRISALFTDQRLQPPTSVIRSDSLAFSLGLMLEWDCICISGRELFGREIERGLLVPIEVPGLAASRPAVIAHRSSRTLLPAIRDLIPYLRQACAEIAANGSS